MAGRQSNMVRNPSGGGNKKQQVSERFAAPSIEALGELNDTLLLCMAKQDDYASVCGAYDAKEHALASYVNEQRLFNKRDEYGKSAFDLAAQLGHKNFVKHVLERTGDRIDESTFDIRRQLKPGNVYNWMHHACVWNRLDLVKFLCNHAKLIADPATYDSLTSPSESSVSSSKNATAAQQQAQLQNAKAIGHVLLSTRSAKTGETPLEIAKRYQHAELVEFLDFAEKRLEFVNYVNSIKVFLGDTERSGRLSKDDKKKVEKLCAENIEWSSAVKESDALEFQARMRELESFMAGVYEKANRPKTAQNAKATAK